MCIRNTNRNDRNRGDPLEFSLKDDTNNSNSLIIKHPIRKSRTKRRRPKFLSLRLELISPEISQMRQNTAPPQKQRQLTLFPLHPGNLVEDTDREENVALMFENDVASSCCSLQSFLPNYQNEMSVSSEEESHNLAEEEELVRTAMRSRAREAEEKWVCYSEVVEKKEEVEVEEVTSTAADEWVKKKIIKKKKNKKKAEMIGKQLWLKLDYEGILNAWSDKAPLFINGESPQTVPNLHDHPTLCSDSLPNKSWSMMLDGIGSGSGSEGGNYNNNNNNVWKVPEMGQREASVLRYKEKRQSRLFSKRIRYQVRKLNAEKRPRIKGRFVKRS